MKLDMHLSVSEIRSARERLERYASGLQAKADELCRRLAEIGVEAAIAAIHPDSGESGELRSSIHWEQRGEREYLVVADCDYAVYVEFGTGAVGAGETYPGTRPDGISMPNGKKKEWVYFDQKQDRFRITDGQVPQGFMSKSAVEIQQAITGIAKEVFAG